MPVLELGLFFVKEMDFEGKPKSTIDEEDERRV